jgi:hypothetical protein
MTDRIDDIRESRTLIPEVIDEPFKSVLTPEEAALFNDTISFINRTVSAKALETALLIGNYILINYFNDDLELAFSKDPVKPVSFNILCEHPELSISRYKLINMVKVAAQERFFRSMDFNSGSLGYTHHMKLTRLPNDENKIDMVRECIAENLTTRQLGYRVKMKAIELEPAEDSSPDPASAEKTFNTLVTSLDRLTGQAASLNFESFAGYIEQMDPHTGEFLRNKIMTLVDTMDDAETKCEGFLQKLQPQISEEKY